MHGGLFDLDRLTAELHAKEVEMSDPEFWNDPDHAKAVAQEADDLRSEIQTWESIQREVAETIELMRMAHQSGDASMNAEFGTRTKELVKRFTQLEFTMLFSGPHDARAAIVAIHAGTGGVDAQDWAEMLFRMILRFCEKRGWRATVMEEQRGNEAGIKRAVIDVQGRYVYGNLKSESGVHRLVRISPFDAEQMRQTSFALIEVIPDLGELPDFELKEDELKIETFRSSGHGGQSVNTTDSAVRITHLPTSLTVSCQNERSQSQNKAFALKMLKSKLAHLAWTTRQEEEKKIRGEYMSAEWGNQIRSYVLHPYKLVKDHRTDYEETDPQSVLDGNLDGFIEAYLRQAARRP
jgi:peptide chain release factor 2